MELRICPGIEKMYRLALVDGDEFSVLSEHDTPLEVCAAKLRAEMAMDLAEIELGRAFA